MPAISLSEPFQKPTTMLYRNLLAMETEELLRSYPFDGAVLLGGCDKTTPALVMGAVSAGLPFMFVPCGPMMRARWRGATLGSGSDVWKYWAELRAGNITQADWEEVEERIASTPGHCMTMGTASTMTSAVEALGVTMPGAASIPAADSDHPAHGGRRRAPDRRRCPTSPLTLESFENAITVVLALGGSTNAVIHLIAMAGRAGVPLSLDRFDELSRTVPRAGQHPPVRQVPDAGLLRGGRAAGADGAARPARRDDRVGVDGVRDAARAPRSSTTTSSARGRTRCRPRRAWRSCAARWRPTAA